MENILIYLVPIMGLIALVFMVIKSSWVAKQEVGTDKMKKIASFINEGALAFLKAEYKILSIFIVSLAILLFFTADPDTSSSLVALSFVIGAICSGLAGFIGMNIATKANVRTANAARKGLNQALKIAFAGGSVMGLSVVGLGILGLSLLFIFTPTYSALTVMQIYLGLFPFLRGFIRGINHCIVCQSRWRYLGTDVGVVVDHHVCRQHNRVCRRRCGRHHQNRKRRS
jgi:K(+)-stimulated pyrophosphate-energized sodium pump